MKRSFLILSFVPFLYSCHNAGRKAKESINKTGEAVGKAGSEFVNGVSKGVERTFQNEVIVSEELKKDGLKTGKIIISGTDSTTDNILSVYLIFDKRFEQKITVKVFSENGQEYGRASQVIKAQNGDAKYFDFLFDNRTNIDSKGKVTFE